MYFTFICVAAFAVGGVLATSPPKPPGPPSKPEHPKPDCNKCPKNEEYLKQTMKCQITCKNMHLEPIMGPCYPSDGCYCIKDYVRDVNGRCVPRKDCPTYCKDPLKEWTDCGSACPPSCKTYNNTCLACTLQCVEGCFCKKEYVLNDEGKCIKPENCPRKCGINQYWDWCPSKCPSHQNCSVLTSKFECKDDIDCCEPKCRCIPGHYKNDEGICVTAEQCSHKCGAHAYYDDCSKDCKTKKCTPGCKCKTGYVKKGDNCVKDNTRECPKNEYWTDCINPCPKGAVCIAPCIEGCLCNEGYERKNGVCVRKANRCGAHAYYDNCNKKYKTKKCTPGCKCKTGYVKKGGNCVKDNTRECPINEYWTDCINPCPKGAQCFAPCIEGCLCNEGYERKDGLCVRKDPECGDNEEYNRCGTSCPMTCSGPAPGPCTKQCVPGCYCKEGYVRDRENNNNCILQNDCPPRKCGKHEKWSDCGTACPDTCENHDDTCGRGCTDQCVRGCFCEYGYVRDPAGRCVKPKDCPKRVCHKPHEHLDPCPTNCPYGDSCNLMWSKFNCTNVPKCCRPACRCDSGRFRNRHGFCITGKQCTEQGQCGDNSYYDENVGDCVCYEGYYENQFRICVKEEPTTPEQCGPNSHYVDCETNCDEGVCVAECISGCKCDEGYVWNEYEGVCKKDYTQQCGANSHYDECASRCPPDVICKAECVGGCVCDDGYEWSSEGDDRICIKKQECTDNAHYDLCPPTKCPPGMMCPAVCIPACVCNAGYKFNKDGLCVKKDDDCGPHAHWDPCPPCPKGKICPAACIGTCVCDKGYEYNKHGVCTKTPGKDCGKNAHWNPCPPTHCPPGLACATVCKPRCECDDGYEYNKKGDCVKKQDDCGSHAHWDPCPPCPKGKICPAACIGTCVCDKGYEYNKHGICTKTPGKDCGKNAHLNPCPPTHCPPGLACATVCKPRCECDDGYEYNKKGDCVKKHDDCGPHANWDPCPPCPKGKICPAACIGTCVCDKGYEYNKHGVCTKMSSSGYNEGDCGKNAHLNPCPPINCPRHMACPAVCPMPRCECDAGYQYNKEGDCVKNPGQCKKNQEYKECGTACPPTCDKPNPDKCIEKCVSGCFCKPGYFKNKNGDCIEFSQCPNDCGKNEIYSYCAFGCPTNFCAESNGPVPQCMPPYPCKPGCVCKAGYKRNNREENKCILKEDCPPPVICDKDEHFARCGSACPLTCDEPEPKACTRQCVRGCFCDDGLVRNKEGKCVPKDSCLKCPPNSHYDKCPGHCPPGALCKLTVCRPSCECDKGYVKDLKGHCVKQLFDCKKHETYVYCAKKCPLNAICEKECISECQCWLGYTRNEQGISKKTQCKPNEEYKKCGTACPRTCEKPFVDACTEQCVPGCFCKDGLFRTKKGDCVEFRQCPNNCGRNETYAYCHAECPTNYCPESNAPPPECDPPYPCPPGCICKKGFIRNNMEERKCIPKEECPPPVICGDDEYYNQCGSSCPRTCDNPNPTICDKKCNRGCFCNGDLVRNKDGKCVALDQCPTKKCSKPYEKWDDCNANPCQANCDDLHRTDPKMCPAVCTSGCICIKGYYRNSSGDCVKPEQCPKQCSKKHERWDECNAACQDNCSDLTRKGAKACPAICKSGCVCQKGYYRNSNGECVKPDQCPKQCDKCPDNEEYKSCGTACPRTCKNKDIKIKCIQKCVPGCFCKGDLVRDENNKCIPPKNCKKKCPDNEEYKSCGTACPRTCKNKDIKINCIQKCVPGCFCKGGLVRDENKKCIPPKKCKKKIIIPLPKPKPKPIPKPKPCGKPKPSPRTKPKPKPIVKPRPRPKPCAKPVKEARK